MNTSPTGRPIEIPLWPGGAPGSEDCDQEEERTTVHDVAVVRNVTQPSLTVYLPDPSTAVGAAAIVCPGGAFHFLSIGSEGEEVARWLTARGIAACVLKYRLIRTGDDFAQVLQTRLSDQATMDRLTTPLWPLLLADGRRAVRVVRDHSEEWGVRVERVGMVGFSAGSSVTETVALDSETSGLLGFAAAIYSAGHQSAPVPPEAPPLFILCAVDDDMASPLSLELYSMWRAAGRETELHIYSRGGHGFGMRRQSLPSDGWIERFHEWLGALGLLESAS